MQDFVNRETILSSSSNLEKQEKWLNKDRVWNFVFWFGMSFGLACVLFFGDKLKMDRLAIAIGWITFLGMPLLIRLFNGTRLKSDTIIINSEGHEITKDQLPYSWPFAALCGPLLVFVSEGTFLPSDGGLFIEFIGCLCIFSGFSIYLIAKNCPVSIFFSKHFWSMRTTGMFATPRESIELGTKLFNVVEALDAKLKSEPKDK